jgi:hypothetical protein
MKLLSKSKKEIICALFNCGCRGRIEFRREFEAFLCDRHVIWIGIRCDRHVIWCELMATLDSSDNYYASIRAPAIISHELSIGRVFTEYKDNLVVIDGENKKEREYLIPKSKVDRYGDNEVYFNISESSLKEFEI